MWVGCVHLYPFDAISCRVFYYQDVIFAGDFNADCGYVGTTKWKQVTFRSDERFVWLLDDDADTTVAKSSCAYDR